jgi:glycylpeptide N-tetradecanoyltransferase
MGPVLIKEITRRVNLTEIWQAIYTSGELIPHPFCATPYYHRSLNPKKLVETGFTPLPKKESLGQFCKRLKTPSLKEINIVGTPRLMEEKDIQ